MGIRVRGIYIYIYPPPCLWHVEACGCEASVFPYRKYITGIPPECLLCQILPDGGEREMKSLSPGGVRRQGCTEAGNFLATAGL